MAYNLKYYAEVVRNEATYRLNIYQRDYTGSAKVIGTLCALNVGYVGSSPIESAIIKSELSFSLVDAWKMEDKYDASRSAYVKYGRWEEFYTSDALLYKVELEEDSTTRWSGFLTPDSYGEELHYGGTVSFVARDMIGHLSDFDYDYSSASGMVSVGDLLTTALSKCGASMPLSTTFLSRLVGKVTETGTSYPVTSWMICADAFEGKTWYQAIEGVLDSFGLTLGWDDSATFLVAPLRYLVEKSRASRTAVYANVSGYRSLDPAVRKIVETLDYTGNGSIWEQKGRSSDYEAGRLSIFDGVEEATYLPSATSPWTRTGNIGLINQFDCTGVSPDTGENYSGLDTLLFVRGNKRGNIARTVRLTSASVPLRLSFTLRNNGYHLDMSSKSISAYASDQSAIKNATLYWGLKATKANGGYYLYNASSGKWEATTTVVYNEAKAQGSALSFNLEVLTPEDALSVTLYIYGAQLTKSDGSVIKSLGFYACVDSLKLEQADASNYEYFKTTTIYSEKNNVIYQRTPALGQVPPVASPHVITNGVYSPDSDNGYPALQFFQFTDGASGRLSVLVHKQILLFYDRPNNDNTGEIIDGTSDSPKFSFKWRWNESDHLLTGGTLDVLSGRVVSSVLRQYATWSEIWGGISVSPTSYSAGASGGSKTFTITVGDDQTWNVLGLPSWISASASSGTGSGSVTLTVASNPDFASRSASFTIAGEKVTITQSAKASTTPTWDATSETVDYPAQDVESFCVASNGKTVNVTSSQSWLKVENVGQGGYLVSVLENTTTSSRTGTITLSWSGSSKRVTITQTGRASLDPTWNARDVAIDETAQIAEEFDVDPGSISYSVNASADWLYVEEDEQNRYIVYASANDSDEIRTGTVTLSWSGGGSLSVTISQAGKDNGIPTWNAHDVTVDADPQIAETIVVRKNGVDVTIDPEDDWVEVTEEEEGLYVVRVTANNWDEDRSTLVIMTWPGGSESFVVYQLVSPETVPTWNAYDSTITAQAQNVEVILVKDPFNQGYTMTTDDRWLEVSRSSGVWTVFAYANDEGATRTAHVTLAGNGWRRQVTITQYADPAKNPTWNAIDVTSDWQDQEIMTFAYNKNGHNELSFSSSADWLSVNVKSATSAEIHVDENTDEDTRVGTISMNWNGGSRSVTVAQGGMILDPPTWDATDKYISGDAQAVENIAVNAKGNTVAVTSSASWLTVTNNSGVYSVVASANTGSASRSATITLSWGSSSKTVTITQARSDTAVYHTVTLGTVTPSSATVTLNGEIKTAGQFLIVREGSTVLIEATATGYSDYSQSITVLEDMTVNVTLSQTTTQYTVTLNLTQCYASIFFPTTDSGQPYTNTITPEDGYTIGSVIVQMGGRTQKKAYTMNSDGTCTISISRVTGNIGITVIAR